MVLRVAKLRNDSRMLYLSALSALLGCATWRLTYSLVAFNPGGGYHYFPTWEELLISIGFVAIEICAYRTHSSTADTSSFKTKRS